MSTEAGTLKPRILVVDDSRVMRRAVTKILGDSYEVIEAEHGEDGWSLLINDPQVQVVFTDLSMPYLDGFGLLARIRSAEDERLREIPVIIITGKDDDEETKQRALGGGATDFITKPFDSVQLKARAQAHVRFEQTTRKLSAANASLELEAALDPLTGLGSKRYFQKAASETLAYAKRHGQRLVVMRLDVDGFNRLFIRNGRDVANQVLQLVGQRLAENIRQEDRAARVGLASFALLLQSATIEGALKLADRIRAEVRREPLAAGDASLTVTVSIGLSEPLIRQATSVEDMLMAAEQRLAQAVQAGGDRVVADGAPEAPAGGAPDLEAALKLVAAGEQQALAPHAETLLRRLLPLLEFCAERQDDKTAELAKALRDRLNA